jgi:hypothetical protein
MKVSGWSKGSANNHTGAGYGVGIKRRDRDRHFPRSWGSVEVVLDNGEVIDVSLSETFWTTCPELRGSVIGRWILDQGGHPLDEGEAAGV